MIMKNISILASGNGTNAENIIRYNFTEMKKLGKEDKFYEILKANNINPK